MNGRALAIPGTGDTPPSSRWNALPHVPVLAHGAVHVWRATLDVEPAHVGRGWRILAADEQARAARFRCPTDRARFVAGRAWLRTILAGYLHLEPRHVRLTYSAHGKPRVLDGSGRDCLHFNLSHSRDMALFAVARDRPVGVDVEFIRPELADEEVAERFFSERECAALRTLAGSLWQEAFFRCWTRKEAYLKALGCGLEVDLKSFDVSVLPEEPAVVLSAAGKAGDHAGWSLQDVRLGSGYMGVLAARGHGWRVQHVSVA